MPAEDDSDNAELDNDDTEGPRSHQKRSRVPTELDPEKLKAFEESERRRGVVYVSRIPPFMKPVKLRHMLEQFAKIGRVYLAPEGTLSYCVLRGCGKSGAGRELLSSWPPTHPKSPHMTEGLVEFIASLRGVALQTPASRLAESRRAGTRSRCSPRRGWSLKTSTRLAQLQTRSTAPRSVRERYHSVRLCRTESCLTSVDAGVQGAASAASTARTCGTSST